MKFQLVYFDDQIQNIDAFKSMLRDSFNVIGVQESQNYETALQDGKPHGIIIDLHMPELDGLALYDKIICSDHYNGCPIFFISGDISDESRLKTIQAGALDFFHRSIGEEELKLRLTNKIKIFLQGTPVIEVGNLLFDSNMFITYINGEPINLTLVELRILSYVMRAMPQPVHKAELLEKLWVDSTKQGKIHVHLSNMKTKLWNWNHELRGHDNSISIVPL